MLLKLVAEDLGSLWKNNYIERARVLNDELGKHYFDDNTQPMFFTGNPEAETVLVMLNPGYHDPDYDFSKNDKGKWEREEKFVASFLDQRINFGELDKGRHDNFDLKQAAFLYSFPDPALNIHREFWKNTPSKLEAKRNVLMNKLQLELIPYCSASFSGLLDTMGQAERNFQAFRPYLESLLETIFSASRRYVIFCSRQFEHLFIIASINPEFKYEFSLSPLMRYKEGGLILSCRKVVIKYEDISIKALIANSFASQALPNAYNKMIRYGKFCLDQLED